MKSYTNEFYNNDFNISILKEKSKFKKTQIKYTNWAYKNPWIILICLCLASISSTMAGVGFLGIVIQEVEKHYGLSSTYTGFISACLDISFCVIVVFIGWKVQKRYLMLIAFGMIVLTFGCFLFAFPIFLFDKKFNIEHQKPNISQSLCLKKDLNITKIYKNSTIFSETNKQQNIKSKLSTKGFKSLLIFYVAFGFIGAGAAPIFTLVPIILKNLLPEKTRSTYIAIFYMSSLGGPSIAYFCSIPFLKLPVFLKPITENNEFIGAWWLCFIFAGCFSFISFLFTLINAILFDSSLNLKKSHSFFKENEFKNLKYINLILI